MRTLFTLVILFKCFVIYSQLDEREYILEYITTKEGLSNNYVTSVVSDSLNLKWFGTENGITKYNGYDFNVLKPGDTYPEFKNENIETLFIDSANNLWIGTKSGGLSKLIIETDEIVSYNDIIDLNNQGDLRITAIAEGKKDEIWVGTWENGLFVINSETNELVEHYPLQGAVYAIKKDAYDNVWFTNNRVLSKYDATEKKIVKFNFNKSVFDILPDERRNKIWVTVPMTKNTKLYFLDTKNQKLDSIETNVTSDFSKTLLLDNYHRIWIGTWGHGLYVSNPELTRFEKVDLVNQDLNKKAINYATILDLHRDENDITWVTTAYGGVVKLIENEGFQSMGRIASLGAIKANLNIHSLYADDSSFWLGTLSNGLYVGDSGDNLTNITELSDLKINTIYRKNNLIYVGTQKGLHIYDRNTRKRIFADENLNKISAIYIDSHNNLILGTQQRGLMIVKGGKFRDKTAYTYYRDSEDKQHKLESDRITGIVEDNQGNIWVGTYNGVHLFDPRKEIFYHQSQFLEGQLPSVIINNLLPDTDYLWLGTPGGLIKTKYRDKKLQIIEEFTSDRGLGNDFINAMTLDAQDNLWFTNQREIVRLSPNGEIVSFGELNGVVTTSFNLRSCFNFNNETIYFGGSDNVVFFNPESIGKMQTTSEVILTNLKVNNKIVTAGDVVNGEVILEKDFSYVDKIELTHKDKLFSIGFASNDYLGKSNIKYRYKLEGFQSDWIDLQSTNELFFTGLDAGSYILKVQATRNNINWSEAKTIAIKILPAPWFSIWAFIAYFLVILVIAIILIDFFRRQNRLKNNLEIIRIEKEKQQELNEAKISFFTNISHELRTPLTLILSPLTELLEANDFTPKVSYQLNAIEKNAKRLLNLINQLLDFRKADHGLLKLRVAQGNFVRFASEVFLYFKDSAERKDITYTFKAEPEEIEFLFDRNKMEIVLCNLLSNAIKYCEPKDKLTLKISKNDGFCVIQVKDTGMGMDARELNNIFDKFYQIQTAQTAKVVGSGLGLSFSKNIVNLHHGEISVASKLNEGTVFTVKLPLENRMLQNDIDTQFMKTDDIGAYSSDLSKTYVDTLQVNSQEYTLLIIDDNAEIREYLKSLLSESYTILEARNGVEGLDIATKQVPDLIVSDVMMPEKDGISLCKELKSQISTSHIPVILLTARSSTVFEINGLNTGADDYITKPFNANVVKARINSLLENRRKLQEHLLNKVRFEPTKADVNATIKDPEDDFIEKAILLVEDNLQNPDFGIENMVDELYMSQSTLYRKIKSLTGLSLTAFIRSIRLKKAAQIILTSNTKLSHIAYEVGFNDYKYFKKSFVDQFDCLPSEYRDIKKSKIKQV
ncbi:two-component regulator propeller domain-containing protein [Leeuwenhoekiella nanhaiensis]|uniref:histidine kinase n=1 Tax=Leeuwenhoekiella nanhaiensis TaxID=1655491 RepID=A0A2G1VPV4_9FLAO|nr:two-component regulator propeller domain-containing protein [Leeuwenhoekiella nanhaiensis]PHQ28808.1 hypothetical protein CJ305_13400 [Leeuwenhoekiella nanhaiensis]